MLSLIPAVCIHQHVAAIIDAGLHFVSAPPLFRTTKSDKQLMLARSICGSGSPPSADAQCLCALRSTCNRGRTTHE